MRKILEITLVLIVSLGYIFLTEDEVPLNLPRKPIIVAVIDTGLGFQGFDQKAKLCKYGHKNFTKDTEVLNMTETVSPVPADGSKMRHGTNIAGAIQKVAGNVDYCMVIIKYWAEDTTTADEDTVRSIKYATNIGADIINYSSWGTTENWEETQVIKKFIDGGGIFVTAIGNSGIDLDLGYSSYPAMADSRIISVGNLNKYRERIKSSNFGKMVKVWEVGEDIEGFGITLTGTSQATAITTGKIIKMLDRKRKLK